MNKKIIIILLIIFLILFTGCKEPGHMEDSRIKSWGKITNYYFNVNDTQAITVYSEMRKTYYDYDYTDFYIAFAPMSLMDISSVSDNEILKKSEYIYYFKKENYIFNEYEEIYYQECEINLPMDLFDKSEGSIAIIGVEIRNVYDYYKDNQGEIEIYKENGKRLAGTPNEPNWYIGEDLTETNFYKYVKLKSFKLGEKSLKGIDLYSLNINNLEKPENFNNKLKIKCFLNEIEEPILIYKLKIKNYDFNEELSNEKIVYVCDNFEEETFTLEENKIYMVTVYYKNGDYSEWTFNTGK